MAIDIHTLRPTSSPILATYVANRVAEAIQADPYRDPSAIDRALNRLEAEFRVNRTREEYQGILDLRAARKARRAAR